jgi:hypothetical protein
MGRLLALVAVFALARVLPAGAAPCQTLDSWVAGWKKEPRQIFGIAGGTLIVLDDDGVARWDGCNLTRLPPPGGSRKFGFGRLWASSAQDIWAWGMARFVDGFFHWDGRRWTEVATREERTQAIITTVWGSSASDVWFGGQFAGQHGYSWHQLPALLHWDGSRLREVDLSTLPGMTGAAIEQIQGSGPHDVWIQTRYYGPLWRWDGARLAEVVRPEEQPVSSLAVSQSGDVWLTSTRAFHWEAGAWVPRNPERGFEKVMGGRRRTFGIQGETILIWDGGAWQRSLELPAKPKVRTWSPYPSPSSPSRIRAVHIVDDDEGWALLSDKGGYQLLRWNGRHWSSADGKGTDPGGAPEKGQ